MNSRIEKWIQHVELSLQSDVIMQQKGEEEEEAPGMEGGEGREEFGRGTGGPLGLEVRAEAQSIINALMEGESPVPVAPPRLLSPDWSGDLDVQSAASSIVDHLMSKPLDISLSLEEEQQRVTDPRVAMETRHRKIQEKRKAREYAQRMESKERSDRKEARRRAEREVLRLEKERRAKEKADEALVQLEVTRIRKQMQEERTRQQWYSDAMITTTHHHRDLVYDERSADNFIKEGEDVHPSQGRAEKPPKKLSKGSTHTRSAAASVNRLDHINQPLPPPPPSLSSKSRHRGEGRGRRRHHEAHDRTNVTSEASAAGVAPSLSSTSSASSLVRMERVTAYEQRQRLKVMRRSFTHWQRLLVRLRVAGGRAAATWEWRAMLRAWREWKMAAEEKRKEKTVDITSAVQRELRHASMAVLHRKRHQLRQCFSVWSRWCRAKALQRETTRKADARKEKMSSLLQAVKRKGEKQTHPQQPAPPLPPSDPQQKPSPPDVSLITSKIVRQELEKILVDSKLKLAHEAQPPTEEGNRVIPSTDASSASKTDNDTSKAGRRTKNVAGSRRKAQPCQQPASTAPASEEKGLTSLHSDAVELPPRHNTHVKKPPHIETVTVALPSSTVETLNGVSIAQPVEEVSATQPVEDASTTQPPIARISSRSVNEEKLLVRKPPTKPVPLSGMEKRTEEIARRKEERRKRQKQAEEEEIARKVEEEETKAREARVAKEALLVKKREERELAKQKELDRQKQLEQARQMSVKAGSHYRTLQCRRCLSHWQQFVLMVRRMMSEADSCHQSIVYKRHFVQWAEVFEERVEAMLTKASEFHRIHLMKRSLHGLKEHVQCVQDLHATADAFNKHRLVRLHMKAWLLFVTEERLGMWEKERMAKKHHTRMLTVKMFRSWTRFVPLSKQGRERERRRTELRLKVASWLPDYQAS